MSVDACLLPDTPESPCGGRHGKDASLADWLIRLEQLHPKTIDLGLARVAEVARRLFGNMHFPCILTVAGTNGKGSTCAFLESMLLHAGYRVGTYTSPHLMVYNERVRIQGVPVTDDVLVSAFRKVETVRGDVSLTYFEYGTLAAMLIFCQAALDVIILEVGLGGRLDAVNVFDTDCAVVTSIDLDHTEYLGTTREAIGAEKAGIFRSSVPVVCGDSAPPASLRERARQLATPWHAVEETFTWHDQADGWDFIGVSSYYGLPHPGMAGRHQLNNAAVAIATLACVRHKLPVHETAIRQGLRDAWVAGRYQRLPGKPERVFDVAHNPHGARALADSLHRLPVGGKTFAVFGMLADKDMAGVVAALRDEVDVWLLAGLDVPRGAGETQLEAVLLAQGITKHVALYTHPALAWQAACELARENDRIVTVGSFYTVAAVLQSALEG